MALAWARAGARPWACDGAGQVAARGWRAFASCPRGGLEPGGDERLTVLPGGRRVGEAPVPLEKEGAWPGPSCGAVGAGALGRAVRRA